ncbi:MAG: hypothetical protein KDI28_11200 [Pseudomonadales bacterium]|nr:hypothetical protein [Pseudomonadales bacterium]MCP5357955.1 hypothetical protein [Pseudomonadales bacterium]
MSQSVDPAQLAQWHRYFAVECNNLAWNMAESEGQAADPAALLNLAHSSAWHWQQTGTEQQKMRAVMLLAQVHTLLGLAATALSFAEQMRVWFLAQADTPDWELAFVHAIHAHACAIAGKTAEHAAAYHHAERALAAIADEQDRAIVLLTFQQVPKPT